MAEPVVLLETREARNGRRVAFATLNAERSLNALSLEMAERLTGQLHVWEEDPAVACVVLQGAGERAFCAGGDIVALYHAMSRGDAEGRRLIERFFATEYTLDYLLHTYTKPVLCWGHGIVMGGGLGLMEGCSHRIVTDTSRVATPEIAIGLYPDVGSSWFLPRMPGRTGLYVGLTGTHMNAGDALFGGLADYYVQSADKQKLYDALLRLDWADAARHNRHVLSELLRSWRDRYAPPESPLRARFDLINELMDRDSVEDILAALAGRAGGDPWLEKGWVNLRYGSPTSAKIIFEVYHRARRLSLKQVFALELDMTIQVTRHPDLREGIRARVIDKDHRPRWSPPTLAEVSDAYVAEHFVSPWPPDQHPFKDW